MNIADGVRVRKVMCATCVMRREDEGGIHLTQPRRAEIAAMLASGGNQLCHHDDNQTVCRGSRDYQLQLFVRLGLITEPTDEAMRQAMLAAGVTPRTHI